MVNFLNKPIFLDPSKTSKMKPVKPQVLYLLILFIIYIHGGAILGVYYLVTAATWKSWIWAIVLIQVSVIGIVAGAHRLWAHRSYKAKPPLEIMLAIFQTLTFQKNIHYWAREHRVHHKFSETDSDPYNSTRGFFYSHIGWMFFKKSQSVISKGRTIDVSDLLNNPIVMFQKKYYWYLSPLVAFVLPTYVPWYFWNENLWVSWYVCSILRYCMTLHGVCFINSIAHLKGNRPYDRNIEAREVHYLVEGYHNYHHTFPWDYKAAEFGHYFGNCGTAFIDLMAKIGWAYDLKYASPQLIKKRVERSGDGSRGEKVENSIWGWGDKDFDKRGVILVK